MQNRALRGLLTALLLWGVPCFAATETKVVLQPSSEVPLSRALDAATGLSVRNAKIEGSQVKIDACLRTEPTQCGSFRLLALPQCSTTACGPFCLAGDEPAEVRSQLCAALAPIPPSIWTTIQAPTASEQVTPRPLLARPELLAAAYLLVPLLAGLLLGFGLRQVYKAPPSPRTAVLSLVVGVVVLTGLNVALPLVGPWDALLLSTLFVTPVVVAVRRALLGLVLAGLVAVVGLLVLEGFARMALPAPPAMPPADHARLWLGQADRSWAEWRLSDEPDGDLACSRVYGKARWPAEGIEDREQIDGHDGRPVVLHLGDSMVYGLGVPAEDSIPGRLQGRDRQRNHVNSGVPSIGPDLELAIAESALRRKAPAMLVWYIFSGNDVSDMDLPSACCEWRPLLSYDGERPHLACPTPRTASPVRTRLFWLVGKAPAPYPARALSAVSVLAQHLVSVAVLASRWAPTIQAPVAVRQQHFALIARSMKELAQSHNVALLTVVLPFRGELEWTGRPQASAVQERANLVAELEAAGLVILDLAPEFQRLFALRGAALFANEMERDIHLSGEGAEWVAQQVQPLLTPVLQ